MALTKVPRTAVELMGESWAWGSTYWEDKDGSAERELRECAAALDAEVDALRAELEKVRAEKARDALVKHGVRK